MKKCRLLAWLLWLLLLPLTCGAEERLAAGFQRLTLTVDGGLRTALVYVPANARRESVPVVFVFHGHGGSAGQAARSFALDRYWPEAISVYLQGLNTPGQLTDPQGEKTGWQAGRGDQGDRDLKFLTRCWRGCRRITAWTAGGFMPRAIRMEGRSLIFCGRRVARCSRH